MHNFEKKYIIARNITYVCLFVEAVCFGSRAYFNGSISLILWLLGAAIIGIPACLAYYFYSGMRREDSDMTIIAVETLEKSQGQDPHLGEKLKSKKPQKKDGLKPS